jgi:hypothetical protein
MALGHQAQRAEIELQIALLKDTLATERALHSAKQATHQHDPQAAREHIKQEHDKVVSGLQAQAAALRAALLSGNGCRNITDWANSPSSGIHT